MSQILRGIMSNKPTLQEKIENNIWDRLFEVLPTIEAAKNGKWSWLNNSRCKYIDLRIDMRTGHCILSDKDGTRINPEDFAKQTYDSGGLPWRWPAEPKPTKQEEVVGLDPYKCAIAGGFKGSKEDFMKACISGLYLKCWYKNTAQTVNV